MGWNVITELRGYEMLGEKLIKGRFLNEDKGDLHE